MRLIKNVSVLAIAALVLVACGQEQSAEPSQSASPSASETVDYTIALSADDAMWLATMLAHHQQAIDMTDLASSNQASQDIKALATTIRGAQYPEMEYMNGLLFEGGYKEPLDVADHVAHMQGMLTADQLAQLGSLTGAAFNKAFLEAMIAHHAGAVSMSENMLVSGRNLKVKELASKIIAAQNADIVKMRVLLSQL